MGSNPTPTVAEACAGLVNHGTTRPRILRVAPGEHAGAWAQALEGLSERSPGSRILKQEGSDAVWACALLGRSVIVKRRHTSGLGELARRMVGITRAERQWRGCTLLRHAGIPTAQCLILARASESEWLVMEELPGQSLLSELAKSEMSAAAVRALAAGVGELVSSMAAAKLFNRDQKPSNIIATKLDTSRAELAVIDTVGVRRCPSWREDFTVRMLASLVIEPRGTGILIPRTAMMRALARVARDRTRRRELWRRVERAVRGHGDPTPKVDPLSR